MFNKELASRIDELIKEKFPLIYDYKFDGIVLLYGGAIKSLIMNQPIKDLDFVILTQGECQLKDFIKKFKLRFYKNAGGGYKILYNDFSVDISSVNDLLETGLFNIDMLFYDIEIREFISCGAIDSIKNKMITLVGDDYKYLINSEYRLNKLINFIKFVSNDDGKIKLKFNKFNFRYKKLKKKLSVSWNRYVRGNFKKCFRFLSGCKKEFNIIVGLGLLLSLISLLLPTLSGKLITFILNKNYNTVFLVLTVIAILKILVIVFSYLFAKIHLIIRKRMLFNIRKEIIKCVMSFEMNSYNDNNGGAIIDKLAQDPIEIVNAFDTIKDTFIKGIGNFGLIIYIFCLDYRIGLVLLIFMLIMFKIKLVGINKRRVHRRTYFLNQERYTGVLGEMINGMNDIKTLDLKDNYMKRTIDCFEIIGENEYTFDSYTNLYNKIVKVIRYIALGVILFLGLFLVNKSLLDASSLVIIFMYHSSMFMFLDRLGILMNAFSDLNVSCYRIFNLLNYNLYVKEIFGNKYNDKCDGKIEFNNMKFRYNDKSDYVLNGCSFKVKSNETVALVGRSGEGKTTILNLIARLYNADDNALKIDGIDINEYSEEFIRENISVISQNPYLFDMSIKENLRLVNENITDSEIKEVCKLACIDEFIETLPKKYDTVIGEGGVKLSGGQKQRLAIARALIKKTKIILLDEITSALDNETSSLIKKVINNIQKDHTIIIVTHELSMIKDCARILVLDNGKIVGDGTHKELVSNNDIYKKLYKIK